MLLHGGVSGRSLADLHSRPPAAPSTVFLGLISESGVRPTDLPTKKAPTSAAMMHATARKVASSPTVHWLRPPSSTCSRRGRGGGASLPASCHNYPLHEVLWNRRAQRETFSTGVHLSLSSCLRRNWILRGSAPGTDERERC